jgi:zinc transport system ATP-binding protein
MAKEVIEVKDVWFSYNSLEVLESIDLTVYEDDFVGIIGPNGGGKSTLLKIILGLLTPDRGEVRVLGSTPRRKRHLIGYVPQHTEFDRDFPVTVRQVVLMGRLSHRGRIKSFTREDHRVSEEAITKVEIADIANRQMGMLSGGQRQRVFLARALASDPKILILDEPTASVDTRAEINFFDILRELNQRMAIVMVSHDVGMISAYVKTIACLRHRLIYQHEKKISREMLDAAYECPVDLIAHGIPHRVLEHHGSE